MDGFAFGVEAIAQLLDSAPGNRAAKDLLNHVRRQGRLEGDNLECAPLQKMKWFQVLGVTASRIRTTDKYTVIMTVQDTTHISWVLWILEGGWVMPNGVVD